MYIKTRQKIMIILTSLYALTSYCTLQINPFPFPPFPLSSFSLPYLFSSLSHPHLSPFQSPSPLTFPSFTLLCLSPSDTGWPGVVEWRSRLVTTQWIYRSFERKTLHLLTYLSIFVPCLALPCLALSLWHGTCKVRYGTVLYFITKVGR